MQTYFKPSLIALAAACALVACGGGASDPAGSTGGGSGGGSASTLTLSGTAATGAAIAHAPIAAKCGNGAGSATTAADGSYTIAIAGGALPCVIEVRPASGAALRSVADGSGSGSGSVTVNVTPLTELVAARLAGGSPAELYASFDAAAQGKLSTPALNAAIAAIAAALQGVVDLAGVNPVTDTLVIGNPLDRKLDALQLALASARISLADVVAAVAAAGTTLAPVATLVQPAAASCDGFRSGRYRVLNPHEAGHDAAYVAHLITVNAAAHTVTDDLDPARVQQTITPVAGAPCRFTLPGDFGASTVLVSRSGLAIVLSRSSTGQTLASLVIPEQNLPIGELAGHWNVIGFGRDTDIEPLAPLNATLTVDAAGNVTAGSECSGLAACTALAPPFGSFVASSAGGFELGSGRAFAFKTASGKVSMFVIDRETGSIAVATRQAALALPAVGDVTKVWDLSIGSTGLASGPADFTTTVKTVDAVTGSYTREALANGRIDRLAINTPRTGLRHRPAGSSPTTTGGSVSFGELVMMPLPDTGLWVYSSVGTTASAAFFGVSVGRP